MFLRLCHSIRTWMFGGPVQSPNAHRNSHASTRRLEMDHLEDRTLPSVSFDPSGQAGATPCACALCCGGGNSSTTSQTANPDAISADFTFSNGTTNTSGAAKWAQPNGLGSVITITYSYHSSVTSGLNGITYAQLRGAVQEALGLWARYAPLNFVEVADSGPSFLTGASYPGSSFPMIRIGARSQDGAYGALAYAYFPSTNGLGGDLVLDSSEVWGLVPGRNQIDIMEVLTHEFGHALGLGHENQTNAILNPTYGARYSGPGTAYLLSDDIIGIQALYGARTATVPPANSPAAVSGTAQAIVAQVYRLSLGREASEAELNAWASLSPTLGLRAMITGIERSQEARIRLVNSYYLTYLGRSPSASESQGWAQFLREGASNESVIASFLGSAEFYNRAQSLVPIGTPDERFVRSLYLVVLGRSADSGGLAHWMAQTQSSGRFTVASWILNSAESRQNYVRNLYTEILQRSAGNQEVIPWAAIPYDLQTLREAFLTSEEFIGYIVPRTMQNGLNLPVTAPSSAEVSDRLYGEDLQSTWSFFGFDLVCALSGTANEVPPEDELRVWQQFAE